MARKNAVQHGTPQGYKKHLKKDSGWGSTPCDDCRAAHNREVAEYRERTGRDRSQDNDRRTARNRALGRLAKLRPREYDALLAEELKKMETSR